MRKTMSASCSHGWLRLIVQCIFCSITIISFVLIVYMAMSTSKSQQPQRCRACACRVVCTNIPFFDPYTEDLIIALRQIDGTCESTSIVFHNPLFQDSTIPEYWLSSLGHEVHEIEIIGGNLMSIEAGAFMSPFASNLRRLYFESVTLTNWLPEMLIGLSNLREITIKKGFVLGINNNALEAVDNTLETLTISECGYWNPKNLTGQSNLDMLTTVVLSHNNFNNILTNVSFARLRRCRMLYLNSCRINAIGEGTFDNLDMIEQLFLNNNFLIVLPTSLFQKILAITDHQPRISMHDNLWYCDCTRTDLYQLTASGILVLDPVCYYPTNARGKTFTEFLQQCDNKNNSNVGKRNYSVYGSSTNMNTISMDEACKAETTDVTLVSPIQFSTCSVTRSGIKVISDKLTMATKSKKIKCDVDNEFLKTRYAVQSNSFSLIEITSVVSPSSGNYGLLWYQTTCPNEVYCISMLPKYLRVYNVDNDAEYTFCPIHLSTANLDYKKCVCYNLQTIPEPSYSKALRMLSYLVTTILCTLVGACIVYVIIRKFPSLLKGSDRILFVKHKNVDALILPPKVPLRESLTRDYPVSEFNNEIFTLTDKKLPLYSLKRTKSTRSNKSIAPSYISAMQPTEEQLIEWRLRHHFDKNVTVTSPTSDVSYMILSDGESMYCSLDQNSNNNYESLK